MGPILEEFKKNRKDLVQSIHDILLPALSNKNKVLPIDELPIKITAQGGVGTEQEHEFLIDHYQVDSVGWGSPFLLVPEATTVDDETIHKLEDAKEKDLYLSNISPLGVPFNNLRGNSKDIEKLVKIAEGRPGSSCTNKFIANNNEFTDHSICTASRQYQRLKIKELDKQDLSLEEYQDQFDKITEKSCICVGLGTSALLENDLDTKSVGVGVSVCPGPNMAYFSNKMSLKDMIDHIYGRAKINTSNRPNMFIKELNLYIDYLKDKVEESKDSLTKKQERYLLNFSKNLKEGINYYDSLFGNAKHKFEESRLSILRELEYGKERISILNSQIDKLSLTLVKA